MVRKMAVTKRLMRFSPGNGNATTRLRLCALLVCASMAASVAAQAPHEGWRTIDTRHFRVHYPVRYEAWSVRAASRLESVREAVVREVGFAPPNKTDVVIMNPVSQPNGFVYPLLYTPRMVLFVEPPGPESVIGSYGEWTDLLTTHEMTHLVHLLRPSRNPLQRLAERFLPLSPITLGAPPWVLEGYATVIEGRLTGFGRPAGSMRAAILRKLAVSGRLPSYGDLGGNDVFLGRSLPYLAGSAYLEWLEERATAGSLQRLWGRMTARHRRSFEDSFEGVYGETPQRLYGQFVAELTARAMQVRGSAEGELWQVTGGESGDLAVSPDGKRLAAVMRTRNKPDRLVIWPTGPPEKETREFEKKEARILARDPEDVAPVRVKPLVRKPLHELTMPDGGDIRGPRWLPSGALLFAHRQPDRDGFLHHDLFEWSPAAGALRRITRLAGVFDADPLPGGERAVAVRNREGTSQLAIVNLLTGEVKPISDPSLDRVYSHPRASGNRVAYSVNEGSGWQLFVRGLEGGSPRRLAAPGDVASPEWEGNILYATVFSRGFIEIYRWSAEGDAAYPVTEVSGAAMDPAPSPDGRLFFTSLEPAGFVIRVIREPARLSQRVVDPSLVPAVAPAPRTPVAFAAADVASRPYGIGRQEIATLFGGIYAPSVRTTEAGVRIGDVVGRLDVLAIGSIGDSESPRGAALAAAWRGLPVVLSTHLFRVDEGRARHGGAEARASWDLQFPLHRIALEGGVLAGERNLLFVDGSSQARQVRREMQFEQELRLSAEAGEDGRHVRTSLRAATVLGGMELALRGQRDIVSDCRIALGGIAPSVLPRSLLARRVLDPALPPQTVIGDEYSGFGVELGRGALRAFWRRHRLAESVTLAGAELAVASPPLPLLKLPALYVRAGVARILDGALRNQTKSWFGVTYRP